MVSFLNYDIGSGGGWKIACERLFGGFGNYFNGEECLFIEKGGEGKGFF